MSTGTSTAVAPHLDKAAWHAAHQGKIGSSQVPAILGIDEYVKPWEVWDEIVFGREQRESEPADIRRGERQEANAAERFAEQTGLTIARSNMHTHKHASMLVATADYRIVAPTTLPEGLILPASLKRPGPGCLELKCPRVAKFYKLRDEGLPLQWTMQLQYELEVYGWEWGYFAFYTPEYDDLLTFPVVRDRELGAWLTEKLKAWYAAHVVAQVRPLHPEPPPAKWQARPKGEAVNLTHPILVGAAIKVAGASERRAEAESEYYQAEETFKKLLAERGNGSASAPKLTVGPLRVTRTQSASQRRFDAGAFKAAVKLAQQASDTATLLTLDPEEDRFYFKTSPQEKCEIEVAHVHPQQTPSQTEDK